MVKVQPFDYPLENELIKKIDLMIERCTQENPKRDAVLLIEGAEGEGKTTMSVAIGYYIKWKTERKFNHTRVFPDLKEMMNFLQNTEEEIAVWDEPALYALSGDTTTKIIKNLTRLLMMCRKKRHFIMINMTYFNKFNEYITWQRPLGMIHVYSRKNIYAGRFVYIRKANLERLWHDWRTKRIRNYKKWASRKARGTFPDILNPNYKHNVLSDFNLEYYERKKDEAIMKIGQDSKEADRKETRELKRKLGNITKFPIESKEEFARLLGITTRTLYRWQKLTTDEDEIYNYREKWNQPINHPSKE